MNTKLEQIFEGTRLQRFDGRGLGLVAVWRGGATFNVYSVDTAEEVDCFTRYGDDRGNPIKSIDEAARAVDEWFAYVAENA